MMKQLLALVTVLLLGLAACGGTYRNSLPGSYNTSYLKGSEAFRAKDFDAAARHYGFAASSGHPKALIAYGRLFARGQGVESDPARAAALFEEAHGKSSSYKDRAAYELGLLLMDGGEGPSGTLEPDPRLARSLLVEALDGGENRAAIRLARIYEDGLGVEPDPEKAIGYYERAAETSAFAARDLAVLLAETGAPEEEVERAAELAVSQFEERAESGHRPSWVQLAQIYSDDDIVTADPERVKGYLENIGAPEDPKMQMRLARIYGRIGERKERNRLLMLAADAGNVRAQTQLAKFYLNARTPDTNGAVGRYYAERAISQGSKSAMFYLGLAMLRGDVVERSPLLAETLLRRAGNEGHLGATAVLGGAILRGDIPNRPAAEGKAILEHAADQGSASAMGTLGFAYLNGSGVEEDEAMALQWLRKAADAGHERSQEYLAEREQA